MATETLLQATTAQTNNIENVSTKIEIGALEAFLGILVIVLTGGIALGALKKSVDKIEETLREDIKPEVKKIAALEVKVDTIWKDNFAPASSPRQLNDRGSDILEDSGIKEIIDSKKDELLTIIKKAKLKTAYDVEKEIERVVIQLPNHFPDIVEKLKKGAFKTGADIGSLLFVGSIYMRNISFKELGFTLKDLDK